MDKIEPMDNDEKNSNHEMMRQISDRNDDVDEQIDSSTPVV